MKQHIRARIDAAGERKIKPPEHHERYYLPCPECQAVVTSAYEARGREALRKHLMRSHGYTRMFAEMKVAFPAQ